MQIKMAEKHIEMTLLRAMGEPGAEVAGLSTCHRHLPDAKLLVVPFQRASLQVERTWSNYMGHSRLQCLELIPP